MSEYFDVCIVGSGFGGSVCTLRMVEKGLKTVVLDKGKYFQTSELRQTMDIEYITNLYQVYIGKRLIAVAGKGVGGGSIINIRWSLFESSYSCIGD